MIVKYNHSGQDRTGQDRTAQAYQVRELETEFSNCNYVSGPFSCDRGILSDTTKKQADLTKERRTSLA